MEKRGAAGMGVVHSPGSPGEVDSSILTHEDMEVIQANILKPHGRQHVWCIFLKFSEQRPVVRAWVSHFSKRVNSLRDQIEAGRFYQHQLALAKANRQEGFDRQTVTCFYLSAHGYRKLGFSAEEMPQDASFCLGMSNGIVNGPLSDPPSILWDGEYQQPIDAMILVANKYEGVLEEEKMQMEDSLKMTGAGEVLHVEKGKIIPFNPDDPHDKRIREHFGFWDGISNPETTFNQHHQPVNDHWRLVLEADISGSYGSYLVFRKLEQNVQAFNRLVENIASDLNVDKSLIEAQIIGRFKDGTPLERHNSPGGNANEVFDFEEESDGARCPFHSHIRKCNPRFNKETVNSESRRIIRRGITYGERSPDFSDEPAKGVGMLFMCFQKSIVEQFEHIQKAWCNDKNFIAPRVAGECVAGIDPVIGQKATGRQTQRWNAGYGNTENTIRRSFRNVVRLLGGEYFYAPPVSFLKNPVPKTGKKPGMPPRRPPYVIGKMGTYRSNYY